MKLTDRQTAIILASLRVAQNKLRDLNAMPHFECDNGKAAGRVSASEIDALCEEINCPDFPAKRAQGARDVDASERSR